MRGNAFRGTMANDPRLQRGIDALVAGRYEAASAQLNRFVNANPTSSHAHLLNGMAYHAAAETGDITKFGLAEAAYDVALRLDPSNWLAAYQRGLLYFAMRQYGRASDDLAEASVLEPGDPAVHYALAAAAYYSGDSARARLAISEATRLEPANPKTVRAAALILASSGADQEAREQWQEYERLTNDKKGGATLLRRIDDWKIAHARAAAEQSRSSVAPGSEPSTRQPAVPLPRMVLIDIAELRYEESESATRGLNLLEGLVLTATGRADYVFPMQGPNSRTIAGGLSIDRMHYSLNIANSASQVIEVLSRPTLVAMEGRTSTFRSGTVITVALPGQYGGSLQDKPVGVELDVTPRFLSDDIVELAVRSSRSFVEDAVSGTFAEALQTSQNQINVNVVLRLGDSLILSGLLEKERSWRQRGVPLLQDIPLVQYLFSTRQDRHFNKSVIYILTPRPAEYVWQEGQTGNGQAKRSVDELASHGIERFRPAPNLDGAFYKMEYNVYYRSYRLGDVTIEYWWSPQALRDRLTQIKQLFYY